jgi:hypothetical protein
MTAPSDYGVRGPDDRYEISRLVPVSHNDDRLRNRKRPAAKKRAKRDHDEKGEPHRKQEDEREDQAGGGHVVDTLA